MLKTSLSFVGSHPPCGRDCFVAALQGLALSTFQVVLVPTLVGVLANEFFHSAVKKFTAWLPLVGVVITTLLCASPCAQVADVLRCEAAGYIQKRTPEALAYVLFCSMDCHPARSAGGIALPASFELPGYAAATSSQERHCCSSKSGEALLPCCRNASI